MIQEEFSQTRGFGEPAPLFVSPTDSSPAFHFSAMGGRWVILMFFGSLASEASRAAVDKVRARRALFEDGEVAFFGVSIDPADKAERGLADISPMMQFFWDFDQSISKGYGVLGQGAYETKALLIDPALRIVASAGINRIDWLLDLMVERRAAEQDDWEAQTAPVLNVSRVFEPAFCRELIAAYERIGGEHSGVMRQVGGMTVGVMDSGFKRRSDAYLDTEALRAGARQRMERRLLPMVRRMYGWEATRLERYLVARYDSADRGGFMPHRDNTTPATAHRKFAITINLNDDFDGGALRFPEFGPRTYRPPAGGATVFGCGILHEATPVTRGVRYAFVPFLYDEAGEAVRRANVRFLDQTPASAPAS